MRWRGGAALLRGGAVVVMRVGGLDDLAEELEPRRVGVGAREVARHGSGRVDGGRPELAGGGGGARWVGRAGRTPAGAGFYTRGEVRVEVEEVEMVIASFLPALSLSHFASCA